jgi:hypothetical protein
MSWLTQPRFNLLLIGLTLFGLIGRAFLAPTYFEDYDSLYFARAFKHYSVVDFSPHWPGYPVFIWLAWFANLFTLDPLKSMHAISVTATSLTTISVALLARAFATQTGRNLEHSRWAGLIAAVLWTVVPVTWIDGTEALSDPLAVLLASTSLLAVWTAFKTRAPLWYAVAGVAAGLMLGVRLAYVMLLGPLAWLLWMTWRYGSAKPIIHGEANDFRQMRLASIRLVFGLIVPCAIWFGWQLAQDGFGWFRAGQQILGGHYSSWGESALTDQNPLSRPLRFLETIIALGLGGWMPELEIWRIGLNLAWLLAVGFGMYTLWPTKAREPLLLLGVWLAPHVLWMVSSQDVGSARYVQPIVLAFICLAGIGLTPIALTRSIKTTDSSATSLEPPPQPITRWLRPGLIVLLIAGMAFNTLPLALEHHLSPPIEQQALLAIAKTVQLARAAILFDRPLFFTSEKHREVKLWSVQPDRIPPNVTRFEAGVEAVFALRSSLDRSPMPPWWRPVARLCRNRLLRLRTSDWDEAVLYRASSLPELGSEQPVVSRCDFSLLALPK